MDIVSYTKQFQELEERYKLFEYKDSSGLFFWDVVRFDIFYQMYFTLTNNTKPGDVQNSVVKINKSLRQRLNSLFKLFYYFKVVLFNRKDYVFFICSRYKNLKGVQYDLAADDLLELMSSKSVVFESFLQGEHYKFKGAVNYGLNIYKYLVDRGVLLKYEAKKEDYELFHKISNLYMTAFDIKIDFTNVMKELVNRFHIELCYYKLIFKLMQPKNIFVVQNGIQKALFAAANHNAIKCYELQHGLIGYVHPAYSYPDSIINTYLDTLPHGFLTYSSFWTENLNYPVKQIMDIGNSHLAKKQTKQKPQYDLIFIFADIYTNIFLELIHDLMNLENNLKICIKLHPNQLNQMREIMDQISPYSNIVVIANESTMEDILLVAKAIVAIQSTVVYQALHNDIPVYIYKKLDYKTHDDVLENFFVKKFETALELLGFISMYNKINHTNQQKLSYFQVFNKDLLRLI